MFNVMILLLSVCFGVRYGYEYGGGYDRGGPGGRGGYDDRPRGRYMNRQSGSWNLLWVASL